MTTFNFFKVSKFLLYLALLSVVLVSSKTIFPFIVIKYTFFRTAVILALIFFVLGAGFHSEKIRNFYLGDIRTKFRSPLVIAVSIFILFFLLASVFAFDPIMAFWSNFERGEGGFQLFIFYIYFFLMVFLFKDKEDWRKAFWVSLTAGVSLIFYGLLAHFGIPGFIGPAIGFASFYGSLGNPAYVGTCLMFMIGYAVYLWSVSSRRPVKIILAVLMTIFFIFMLFAQTRGAFLGLVAGATAFILYWAFQINRERKWRLAAGAIFLVLAAFVLLSKFDYLSLPWWLDRLINPNFESVSFQSRLWTWGSALKGWQERPILGWGPENFAAVFDKYFDTRHYIPNEVSETWYDRAHSVYLDYLTETGLLGLLGYLAIFFVFYFHFFKIKSLMSGRPVFLGEAVIFALPIAYLVQGLVIFDVLPIYLNLFLFLAFAVYQFENYNGTNSKKKN